MTPGALTDERDVREAYAAHAAELYGFAVRSLDDSGLAEEGVQETFLRAWRAGDHLRRVRIETYYRGRPYAEVAEELGVPEGTVKSRVYYGLRALRVVLEEMVYEDGALP